MHRWKCPIYNGALETLIFLKAKNAQIAFAEKPQLKINSSNNKKVYV